MTVPILAAATGGLLHEVTSLGYLVLIVVLALLGLQILRFRSYFARTWDAVDKRLSEVLWRTRNSDTQELKRRTDELTRQQEETMELVRTLATTIDSQMELLREELRSSLSKVDYVDSKKMGQQRLIVYQLERMRKQLDALRLVEGRQAQAISGGEEINSWPNRDALRAWANPEAADEFLTQSGINPKL
ncbi:MAG: hypothetical protein HJJLKODD_02310 [Phycisphaerae bacterium]|nr:hypothetical protein [Phycisphaerae bacterium]